MDAQHAPRSAEHYRHVAAQLRTLAELEPDGSEMRDKLLELTAQYERLAQRAREVPVH